MSKITSPRINGNNQAPQTKTDYNRGISVRRSSRTEMDRISFRAGGLIVVRERFPQCISEDVLRLQGLQIHTNQSSIPSSSARLIRKPRTVSACTTMPHAVCRSHSKWNSGSRLPPQPEGTQPVELVARLPVSFCPAIPSVRVMMVMRKKSVLICKSM